MRPFSFVQTDPNDRSLVMEIAAKVICDSLPYWGRERLTTLELTYPRWIHGEFLTHRVFSRNSASSRAIPVSRLLKQVWSDPAMPVWWGRNQPGMQAPQELTGMRLKAARRLWVLAGCMMVCVAWCFLKIGLHKQLANRVLEPWMWMKTIVSGTDWGNFFNLRRHPDAQPEFRELANCIYEAMRKSTPIQLQTGQWHLPYITKSEFVLITTLTTTDDDLLELWSYDDQVAFMRKLSAARCARVSYMNHDGTRPDWGKDLELHDKLITAPHASPFEHQATPFPGKHGNFNGWQQYRQLIPRENQPEYPGI